MEKQLFNKTSYTNPITKKRRLWVVSKRLFIVGVVLLVGGTYGWFTGRYDLKTKQAQVSAADQSPTSYELWTLTNEDRQKAGVAPLKLNPYLEASATAKCADEVQQNYYDHTNPQGLQSRDFIGKFVDVTHLYTDENLAEGYNTSQSTENAWLASPIHKEGIINPRYTDVGFGICTNNNQILVVAHFIGT